MTHTACFLLFAMCHQLVQFRLGTKACSQAWLRLGPIAGSQHMRLGLPTMYPLRTTSIHQASKGWVAAEEVEFGVRK